MIYEMQKNVEMSVKYFAIKGMLIYNYYNYLQNSYISGSEVTVHHNYSNMCDKGIQIVIYKVHMKVNAFSSYLFAYAFNKNKYFVITKQLEFEHNFA